MEWNEMEQNGKEWKRMIQNGIERNSSVPRPCVLLTEATLRLIEIGKLFSGKLAAVPRVAQIGLLLFVFTLPNKGVMPKVLPLRLLREF